MKEQELTDAFFALQSRFEKVAAQQADIANQLNQSKMRSIQSRARRSPIGDLVVAGLTAIVSGGFIADHLQSLLEKPVAALPAVSLFVFAIVLINLSVRQLILSSDIDFAKPIVEAQTHVASLRKLRLQTTRLTFLVALPAWVIFTILLGQMVIGVPFIFALNPNWIIANVAVGLGMAGVAEWVMQRSRYAASIQDTLAGKEIVEAEAFLASLREFQA